MKNGIMGLLFLIGAFVCLASHDNTGFLIQLAIANAWLIAGELKK